jgi:methylenetetrahydrofolate reductase (NADPH)
VFALLIKELFAKTKPVISFEIFPPKKDSPVNTVYSTINSLKDLKPDFISITYGAGGSSKDRSIELSSLVKNKYGIEALAHLTCISSTKQEIERVLQQLADNGIENILAMRGDLPQDPNFTFPDPLHYQYAKDLIRQIREKGSFSIGAACYPEGHIECENPEKDLIHLKEKVEAGTDFLITQLFFDNEFFYRFRERAADIGISIPISAGIMPVTNKKQVERILSLCRVNLPEKLLKIMEKYEHSPEALKEAGTDYATEQIIELLSWGAEGIHIYTMNRPEVAKKIMENIPAAH